jgi:hypothetical protein
MAKTTDQIYAERRQRVEERRKFLVECPEVYRRDFDEIFKPFLTKTCIGKGLDPEDCDKRFDPRLWEDFVNSPEGTELALQYSFQEAWDPYGDELPSPSIISSVRKIWHQDDRIGRNQIRKGSISVSPYKHFGRFLIVEIDLSFSRREIKADIMAWVDHELKELKITELKTGSHHELIERPEPRARDSSYIFNPMEVWKMVEEKRGISKMPESKILSRLAREICEAEGWNKAYGKFEDDPVSEERVKYKRRALKNSYERDKELYYGRAIFRGIHE